VQQEIAQAHLELEGVMNVVVKAAARITASDAAVVELHEGDEMVYRAAGGTAVPYLGLRLNASSSLSGLCVRLNETLNCVDTETDPRVDREACRRVGARSMLVTPLHYRGTALGVLKVYASRAAAFDGHSAEVLRLLEGIVSISMHKARDHETLTRRALRDPLTSLANRAQLDITIRDCIDAGRPFSLLFLDLDRFKYVNDVYGHLAGDEVLCVVADRILLSLRERDLAVRFGGDEFVVLVNGPGRSDAENLLQRLAETISQPIHAGVATYSVGASGGVVMFPEDATSAEELLRIADARMYANKSARKG
jgi:diguanylate cyclase (GGDEF)-like protein